MGSGKTKSSLVKKIKQGNEYAFEIAFLKYYTPLCKYIWKYVRSEDIAEGIVQEVFAIIWETRSTLDPDGNLRGLLYKVSRNKALDYLKHQKIVSQHISTAVQNKEENLYTTTHSENSNYEALLHEVHEAINNLPDKARQIYKLNRDEGLTYTEIAEYLGISVKTVESKMSRVLQILRKRLSKYLPFLILAELYCYTFSFFI